MFNGDQFHQFLASSRTTSLHPIIPNLPPPSFPLPYHHHENPSSYSAAAFDPYHPSALNTHHQSFHHHHQQQQLHHQESSPDNSRSKDIHEISTVEKERSAAMAAVDPLPPWSNDEVVALLRVRSSMEIWFPDFTWEHVSRKLADLGFKRSGEQCKGKFEEESKHFNNNNVNYCNKNYRFLMSELDEFYPHPSDNDHHQEEARPISSGGRTQNMEKQSQVLDQEETYKNNVEEISSGNMSAPPPPPPEAANNPSQESEVVKRPVKLSKRSNKKTKQKKKDDKFEIFKGFCEAFVNKMMAQQEELHSKLIEDIVKRDEEKIAREEAWKNQEMDRIRMEIETRAKEQESAGERQAAIIEFLKKFTNEDHHHHQQHFAATKKIEDEDDDDLVKVNNENNTTSLSEIDLVDQDKVVETSTSSSLNNHIAASLAQQNPPPFHNSKSATKTRSSPTSPSSSPVYGSSGDNNIGKRWPRDEVLALIDLRCKLMSGKNGDDEGGAKGPLWERISQGMMELGYNRNAKRCKEKWENINKYFRKTKDSNKKRCVNSRTCPYFQQLSCLYSSEAPNNNVPPENNLRPE